MEVRVKIGDGEAVVTVANEDEAVNFLEKLSRRFGSSASHPAAKQIPTLPLTGEQHGDENAIRNALLLMQGKPSGKILKMLSDSQSGLDDSALRRLVSETDEDISLAPAFAHVSKCCKKCSLDKSAILIRKSKRGPRGKMAYFYRITDVAATVIRGIPKFDEEPAIEDAPTWDE